MGGSKFTTFLVKHGPDPESTRIASDEKDFNPGNIDEMDTKAVLLTKKGTYTYRDGLSSHSGTIIVE